MDDEPTIADRLNEEEEIANRDHLEQTLINIAGKAAMVANQGYLSSDDARQTLLGISETAEAAVDYVNM